MSAGTLSIAEAARELGVSRPTVYAMLADGRLSLVDGRVSMEGVHALKAAEPVTVAAIRAYVRDTYGREFHTRTIQQRLQDSPFETEQVGHEVQYRAPLAKLGAYTMAFDKARGATVVHELEPREMRQAISVMLKIDARNRRAYNSRRQAKSKSVKISECNTPTHSRVAVEISKVETNRVT